MKRAFFGGRETLRYATTIAWHLIHTHRPLSIRRERDALTVGSSHGSLVVALECEPLDLRVASEVVKPDDAAVILRCLHERVQAAGHDSTCKAACIAYGRREVRVLRRNANGQGYSDSQSFADRFEKVATSVNAQLCSRESTIDGVCAAVAI